MQEVWHDLLGEGAIGLHELAADVEEEDVLAVIQLGNDVVHFLELDALGIGRGFFAAREDGEQQDFGLGLFFTDGFDDHGDALGDGLGAVLARVVGADHENDGLGLDAIEFAVGDAPQHVLGAVAANAEVHWLVGTKGLLPDLFLAAPAGGDGVTQEDEFSLALLGGFDESLMGGGEARVHFAIRAKLFGGNIRGLRREFHRWCRRFGGLGGSCGLSVGDDAEREEEREGENLHERRLSSTTRKTATAKCGRRVVGGLTAENARIA